MLVGLEQDIVHPATTSANLWSRGRLVPMPRTMMGVPLDLRGLDGIISARGLARAAMDNVLPPTELGERDISVGDLVEERLGKEIVDRLVEPLLGGVYAGHARELSARAAVPQMVALLEKDRSLTRAAAAATPPPDPATAVPVFAGIRGGVGRLPGALAAASGATVRTGATVRDLARRADGGWNLVVGSTRDPEIVQADAVVLATPARATARLLSDVTPTAALTLARIEYASMAIVTMAFPPGPSRRSPGPASWCRRSTGGRSRRRRSPSPSGTGSARQERPRARRCWCCGAHWAATARRPPSRSPTTSWSRWSCTTSPTRSASRCGPRRPTSSAGAAPSRSTPSAT